MRMFDIIAKKRDGETLSAEEIQFVIEGYTGGSIPDYQMSAFLMAAYLNGLDTVETATLTDFMAQSGDTVDLSAIQGVKVDKHSTGGVGDKTTLIVGPIAAACGVKIAKMSGRGLGHTGGTVDKLEAIPGFRTTLGRDEFFAQVNRLGISVIGQSGNLAPADKKIYALRDVTATVDSLPLIASSIMSKKLAAGADAILLDVKTGSGAFMKTKEDAIALAETMVAIGEHHHRRTSALITDMDLPLGLAIGNSLEVAESVQTLQGKGPKDLEDVCLALAANMLQLANGGEYEHCLARARQALQSGAALQKLRDMVEAQGGDVSVIDDPANFAAAKVAHTVAAPRSGYIYSMDTEKIGISSVLLGAGRERKEDAIDYAAGIILRAKTGEWVEQGAPLAEFFAESEEKLAPAEQLYLQAVQISDTKPTLLPLIMAKVDVTGVSVW